MNYVKLYEIQEDFIKFGFYTSIDFMPISEISITCKDGKIEILKAINDQYTFFDLFETLTDIINAVDNKSIDTVISVLEKYQFKNIK